MNIGGNILRHAQSTQYFAVLRRTGVESHVSRSLIKRKWREMFASPVECGCWQEPMKMVASSDINVGSFDPRNTAF